MKLKKNESLSDLHESFDNVIEHLSKIPFAWQSIFALLTIDVGFKIGRVISGIGLDLQHKWFYYLLYAPVGYFLYYWRKSKKERSAMDQTEPKENE